MEEDIKEDAKRIIEYCKNSMNFKELGDRVFHEDIANFIENLIARNKELEEMQKINDTNYRLGRTFEKHKWKSKIREKIEEANKKEKEELKGLKGQDRYFIKQIYQAKRNFAEELLQERN